MSVPVLSWLLIASRTSAKTCCPRPCQIQMKSAFSPKAAGSPHSVPTLQEAAQLAQPLEPILFPKLRIYFADFPYLHCSIDQRLLTLETCCGYEYEQTRKSVFPSDFQGPSGAHRTPQEVWCFTGHQTISPGNQIPWCQAVNKKRELFPGLLPTSPSSVALPHI